MKTKKTKLAVEKHILCQVHDEDDLNYGCMFQIGDVRDGIVHGFMVLPGRQMVFITTLAADVTPIGRCANSSHVTCSIEWSEKYGIQEEIKAHKEATEIKATKPNSREHDPVYI